MPVVYNVERSAHTIVSVSPGSRILHRQLGTEAAAAGHRLATDLMPPPTPIPAHNSANIFTLAKLFCLDDTNNNKYCKYFLANNNARMIIVICHIKIYSAQVSTHS